MTHPILNQQYGYARRGGNEETCPHTLAMHVRYDAERRGYRVQMRCRCGRRSADGRHVYAGYAAAEAAGRLMEEKR